MHSSLVNKQLVATHLHASIDDRVILDDVSVSIVPGDRIGLVGQNGSGKSTLLNILAGIQKPDRGMVHQQKIRVGYLQQQPAVNQNATLEDIFGNLDQIANPRRVTQTLGSVGIDKPMETRVIDLSGGERMRVGLAKVLLSRPDILLLDEPTNHLDFSGKTWLREWLCSWKSGFVVVSHDRAFLDDVADTIWELNEGTLRVFGGNYSAYKEQIEHERKLREEQIVGLKQSLKQARTRANRELQRIAHGKQRDISKNAKDHDRFQANFFKEHAEKSEGKKNTMHEERIKSIEEKLSGMKDKRRTVINARFEEAQVGGRKRLVALNDCSIGYDHYLLEHVSVEVLQGDRIAIFGDNGSGKSTFMKALLGDQHIRVDGDVVRIQPLRSQTLDQQYTIVDQSKSVWKQIKSCGSNVDDIELRDHLARFLFREHSDVQKLGSELSGGETARLALAMIALQKIDLLILDEPTNNLDISAIEQVEHALLEFPGGLLVVSHDLAFLRNIGIERIYEIHDKRLVQVHEFPG